MLTISGLRALPGQEAATDTADPYARGEVNYESFDPENESTQSVLRKRLGDLGVAMMVHTYISPVYPGADIWDAPVEIMPLWPVKTDPVSASLSHFGHTRSSFDFDMHSSGVDLASFWI